MSQLEGSGSARGAEAALNASPFFVAIDHRFIANALEDVAQGVYDALGALDAAAPDAIATVGGDDLLALVHAGERWAEAGEAPYESRAAVADASRRVRHLLERD
jgi:hypothetical protein